jgi:hypothetical protein
VQASGRLSFVGCSFEGFYAGLYPTGSPGEANRMFACRCTFSGGSQGIYGTARTHFNVLNCVFAGYSAYGARFSGDPVDGLIVRRTFLNPSNSRVPAVSGGCKNLRLKSVCADYSGFIVTWGTVTQMLDCCFPVRSGGA